MLDFTKPEAIFISSTGAKQEETLHVSATGAKRYSVGKTPYQYLPLDLLDGAARVMEYGAKKYGRLIEEHPNGPDENFRAGFNPADTLSSLMRHVAALQRAIQLEDKEGEKGYLIDESGQAHCHHVVTSTLILIDSMRKAGYRV